MSPSLLNITPELTASVATKTAAVKTLLTDIAGHWSPAAFANSLGAEDMVLTDLIVKAKLPIEIRHDNTIRKQILWESADASESELAAKEVEFIRKYNSNDPSVGYNRWPKFRDGS